MTEEDIHDWFNADGFLVESEQYGEMDLWVVGGDMVETDVYMDGSSGGTRWNFPVEGGDGDGNIRPFSALLVQSKNEDEPTLIVEERVSVDDDYEKLDIEVIDPLYEEDEE